MSELGFHSRSVWLQVICYKSDQALWSQDSFTFLKIIEDSKKNFVNLGYVYPYTILENKTRKNTSIYFT